MVLSGSRNKKTNVIYSIIYAAWRNMIDRCYNSSCHAYKNYGAKGVTVCEDWHTLDGFIQDVDKIKGFDLEAFTQRQLTLDKDKFGDSKEYSVDKCCWISKKENNKYKPNQQTIIIGISPTGERFVFNNQSDFAKEHNLTQSKISYCIHNIQASTKGWKFFQQ